MGTCVPSCYNNYYCCYPSAYNSAGRLMARAGSLNRTSCCSTPAAATATYMRACFHRLPVMMPWPHPTARMCVCERPHAETYREEIVQQQFPPATSPHRYIYSGRPPVMHIHTCIDVRRTANTLKEQKQIRTCMTWANTLRIYTLDEMRSVALAAGEEVRWMRPHQQANSYPSLLLLLLLLLSLASILPACGPPHAASQTVTGENGDGGGQGKHQKRAAGGTRLMCTPEKPPHPHPRALLLYC